MVECRRNRFVTGATLLLDGRAIVVPGFERGVDTLDQAIALINSNPFGNGTALFTQSVSNALVGRAALVLAAVGRQCGFSAHSARR